MVASNTVYYHNCWPANHRHKHSEVVHRVADFGSAQTQQLLALFGQSTQHCKPPLHSSYTLASPQPYMLVSALATGAWPPFGVLYCGCAVRRFRQHPTTQTSSGSTRFSSRRHGNLLSPCHCRRLKPTPAPIAAPTSGVHPQLPATTCC